ncbi:MAG TPA: Type 1 glutamine amidotransferase-like domain-containing protein [Candidatus Saccharibacteria bacterium]|nr:Type 1 glutamine amidotransferase-like domain-containing protein [Candidatus Saccharibacteria bacterium]
MSGSIILSGGGDSKQASDINRFLYDQMKSKTSLSSLYIPLALKEDYFDSAEQWFRSEHPYLEKITVVRNKQDAEKAMKKHYALIYIGGGNTGKLLYQLKEYSLDQYIITQLSSGTIIYGGSAGAIVLGKTITTAPEKEYEKDKDNRGLNLLGNYSIIPHFESKFSKHHFNEAKKYGTKLLGISESSGVIFKGGKIVSEVNKKGINKFINY